MPQFTTYGCSVSSSITWQSIFGANLYEWWDMSDNATISQTGGLVDSITSKGTNVGVLTGSGVDRPNIVTDPILSLQAFDFDGVSDFMEVLSSTADYKFLHGSQGGCIIAIHKPNGVPIDTSAIILCTAFGNTQIGVRLQTGSDLKNAIVVHNGSGSNVVVDRSTELNVPNEMNSLVSIFDASKPVSADKSSNTTNSVTDANNSDTGTPSALDATNNLLVGKTNVLNRFHYNMNLFELIIIDTVPTAQQLADVQSKLIQDYGSFPIS